MTGWPADGQADRLASWLAGRERRAGGRANRREGRRAGWQEEFADLLHKGQSIVESASMEL